MPIVLLFKLLTSGVMSPSLSQYDGKCASLEGLKALPDTGHSTTAKTALLPRGQLNSVINASFPSRSPPKLGQIKDFTSAPNATGSNVCSNRILATGQN